MMINNETVKSQEISIKIETIDDMETTLYILLLHKKKHITGKINNNDKNIVYIENMYQ